MGSTGRPILEVKRVRPGAAIPRAMSARAAGLDLAACLDQPLVLGPGTRALVPTGVAIAIPDGHEGQIRARSGLAIRHGVTCLNSPGTIDADYRGEIQVILVNHGDAPFVIASGDRIAQLVVAPVVTPEIREVTELDATVRGAAGFGSTGRS